MTYFLLYPTSRIFISKIKTEIGEIIPGFFQCCLFRRNVLPKRSLFYKEPVLTDNLTEDKNPLAVVIGKRASWGEM